MRDDNNGGAGLLTLLAMIVFAPFTIWAMRQERWARVEETERNLRRAGQGMLAIVATLAAFFYLYGAHGVGSFLVALVTQGTLWPGAVFLGLIAYGLLRFLIGAGRVAGLRDSVHIAHALRKLALGGGVIAWLWLSPWPWEKIGASPWGLAAISVAGGVALAYAITGSVRFLVLSIGGGSALAAIKRVLKKKNASLRPARRRWWQR